MSTRISLCGALAVELSGRRIEDDLPGRQGRALFGYMLVNRDRAIGRDELIGVLWPAVPPAAPSAVLNTVVARLRAVLGHDVLVGRTDLRLDLPPDAVVDVETARRGADDARRELAEGSSRRACDTASRALEAVSPRLYAGFEGEWAEKLERKLDELRDDLLETLAEAQLAAGGDLAAAEAAARALVQRAPLRESGCALLMRVHARRGDVAEALQRYDELRTRLREELAMAPSKPLVRLAERLLQQGVSDRRDLATADPTASPARSADGARIALPVILARSSRRRLVGRRAVVDHLRRAWAQASGGERSVVMLAGDAGIGKTRVVAELAQDAHEDGGVVLYGRCDLDQVVPYQPIVQMLRDYLAHGTDVDIGRDLAPEMTELSRLVPELRSVVADAPLAQQLPPETQRYRLFAAVDALLTHAASRRSLLLVFDDLHWADRPTLLLLKHIVRGSPGHALMLVGTYRDERLDERRNLDDVLLALRRDEECVPLRLGGLTEEETASLVADRLASDASPDFVRRLSAQTAGNPFFVEEVLRSVDERRGDRASDTAHEDELVAVGVPAGVTAVVEARLDRLTPPARKLLAAAAVAGDDCDLDLLRRVVDMDLNAVLTAVDEAMDAGLLAGMPDRADHVMFCHAIVREALYGQQRPGRRALLHLSIAEALEASRGDPELSALARHWFEARRAAGPDKAIRYARDAAEQAEHAFAYEEAVHQYERALEALGSREEATRCDLLIALAHVQWQAGDARAKQVVAAALESARDRACADQLARAALTARRDWEHGVVDVDLVGPLEEALAALPDGDSALRAKLLARLADALQFTADQRRPKALGREAEQMARRVGALDALAAALSGRHAALLSIEHVAERVAVVDGLLALSGEPAFRDLGPVGSNWRIYDLMELGDVDGARREHLRLKALADESRLPLARHLERTWEAVWATLASRFEEAERLAREGRELGDDAVARDAEGIFVGQMLIVRRDQGRGAEVLPDVQRMTEDHPTIGAWRAAQALVLAELGKTPEARDIIEDLATEGFAGVNHDMFWLTTLALTGEACARLGDAANAAVLYRLLLPHRARSVQAGLSGWWGSTERFLGVLAAVTGDRETALDHLGVALEQHARAGARCLLVRTRLDYAETVMMGVGPSSPAEAARLLVGILHDARQLRLAALAARAARARRSLRPVRVRVGPGASVTGSNTEPEWPT